MILAVNRESFKVEEELIVENVEQVNNLYLIEPEISDILGIEEFMTINAGDVHKMRNSYLSEF